MFYRIIISTVIVALTVFNFSIFITQVQASDATTAALNGLNATAGNAGLGTTAKNPADVIGKALGVLMTVLGIIFLIIVVYGGITWMTAAGDPESVKKGRSMIIEGALGLAVTMAAYSLTYYVVDAVVNATK
jgi:hypothetical protein